MKTFNLVGMMLVFAINTFAADPLTERFQRGLFEEEANHNLDAAIKEYQAVVAQSDEQRKVIATALFRLGECYRKLGRTNEADAQFRRILADFSEQEQLVTLSRRMIPPPVTRTGTFPAWMAPAAAKLLQQEIDLAEQQVNMEERKLKAGQGTLNEVLSAKKEVLRLKRLLPENSSADSQRKLIQQQTSLVEQVLTETQNKIKVGVSPTDAAIPVQRELVSLQRELAMAADAPASAPDAPPAEAMTQAETDALARVKTLARNSPDLLETPAGNSLNELQLAAKSGYYSVAEFLVAQGVKLDGPFYDSMPLVLAAQGGHLRMVKMLVEKGAEINPKNNGQLSALSVASSHGFQSIISYLIEHEANVNYSTSDGYTALIAAVASDRLNVVEFLLAHGAKADGLSHVGFSLRSRRSGLDIQGGTPLHRAVAMKNQTIAELLIRAGAAVNATNLEGQTPLHLAAFLGSTNTSALLLEQGAAVDPVTRYGKTPFYYALSERNTEVLTLLLQRGANPNQLVEISGQPQPALFMAIVLGPVDLLSALLAAKPDLNVMAPDGNTPLFMAIERRSPEMVEALLKAGAEPNQRNRPGYLPLIRTIDYGQAKMFEALLNYKANPDLVDPLSQTARHLAADYAARPVKGEAFTAKGGVLPQFIAAETRSAASQMTNLLQLHGFKPMPPTDPVPPVKYGAPASPPNQLLSPADARALIERRVRELQATPGADFFPQGQPNRIPGPVPNLSGGTPAVPGAGAVGQPPPAGAAPTGATVVPRPILPPPTSIGGPGQPK